MKKIALFASGSGSNAQNIYEYFANNNEVEISLLLTNNPDAYVIQRAKNLNIPCVIFSKDDFANTPKIVETLQKANIDLIVLAGFLWLVPTNLIDAFPNKIINIHPALLPNYGGKGMYGDKVHQAVVANKEKESGITIHYVDSKYDEGKIIFQTKVKLTDNETAASLAEKIHALEYQHFPKVIEDIILDNQSNDKSRFIAKIFESFTNDTFIKLTLGKSNSDSLINVYAKEIVVKGEKTINFVFRYKTNDQTKNLDYEQAKTEIESLLGLTFFHCIAQTTTSEIELKYNKKYKPSLFEKKNINVKITSTHDQIKKKNSNNTSRK